MAKVIGYEPKLMKKCTCYQCSAIVEYAPNEVRQDGDRRDEGSKIMGIVCPGCGAFIRTNY